MGGTKEFAIGRLFWRSPPSLLRRGEGLRLTSADWRGDSVSGCLPLFDDDVSGLATLMHGGGSLARGLDRRFYGSGLHRRGVPAARRRCHIDRIVRLGLRG